MRRYTALGLLLSTPLLAQGNTPPAKTRENVTVTVNPLRSNQFELVNPVQQISEEQLDKQSHGSLGEAMMGTPGVSSSYFGPNASRPMIRGQDGDRIRIMQNGIGSLDASSLSPDHASAIDPFLLQGIEIVRGPAALLYGGSAVGGLVNSIDNRIPTAPVEESYKGKAVLRFGGPDKQKSGAVILETGTENFAIHADFFQRESKNLIIPGQALSGRYRLLNPGVEGARNELPNSAAESQGGAIGGSWLFDKGYAGLSYSMFETEYGTVAEEDVTIDMKSSRWDLATEIHDVGAGIERLKIRAGQTDYEHKELEGSEVGTVFQNNGYEASLEAAHVALGPVRGVVGVQVQDTEFSALGAEAFLPKVESQSLAAFVYEELPIDAFKLSFGARGEYVEQSSDGGGPLDEEGAARFGVEQSLDFRPVSTSVGGLYTLNSNWGVSVNVASTQRAPTYSELFANGPHAATAQFEVGDTKLDIERSAQYEIGTRFKSGPDFANFNVFYNRFQNYIALLNSGALRTEEGGIGIDEDGDGLLDGSDEELLPEARMTAIPADFYGFEADSRVRLHSGTWLFDLGLRGDYLWAKNRDTGGALPRIAPWHVSVHPEATFGPLGAGLDLTYAAAQKRVAENELPTDAYTLLDANVSYNFVPSTESSAAVQLFVRANNLLDREARMHTSILKDIAPLPGRAYLVGIKGSI